MAKKVFIGVGHGGSDPGAVSYIKEANANLTMAFACKEVLEANGVQVKMSRTKDENDTLNEEIKECNAFNPDLTIDIHNNAGGGDGFEVYHSIDGGVGKTLAINIEAEIKAIGQNSRGVKTRKNSSGKDYYGFIRQTKCPAVIVEGVFVDNATDVKIADTVAEQREFGKAYARGILKTLGIAANATTTVPSGGSASSGFASYKVKVICSELNIRKTPKWSASDVVGVIKDKGTYTIVAETTLDGTKFGKLKSGQGWISLGKDYVKRV